MRGVFFHNLDAKGRLNFPAKFRDELGDRFIICRGIPNPEKDVGECLWVLSEDGWERLQNAIGERPMEEAQQLEYYFTNSFDVETDSQGRVLLPPDLRAFAGLDREVAVIGFRNRAEIWDAALWRETSDISGRRAGELMRGIRL
jgi:MraZ protein